MMVVSRMQESAGGLELVWANLIERLELDDHNSIEEIKVPERFMGQSFAI